MYELPVTGNVKAVFFSLGTTPSDDPELDCAKAICDLLAAAKKTAYIAIYSLTEQRIVDSLIAAHHRGVDVKIIADLTQSKGRAMNAALESLEEAGVFVRVAKKQKFCMHNKVAILDSYTVATGSYNWTKNGSKRNNENLVILEGKKIAALYEKYVFDRAIQFETLCRV